MTVMIAALSPADINYNDTLSTLRFADNAKKMPVKVKKRRGRAVMKGEMAERDICSIEINKYIYIVLYRYIYIYHI